jgi:hypothetical protein
VQHQHPLNKMQQQHLPLGPALLFKCNSTAATASAAAVAASTNQVQQRRQHPPTFVLTFVKMMSAPVDVKLSSKRPTSRQSLTNLPRHSTAQHTISAAIAADQARQGYPACLKWLLSIPSSATLQTPDHFGRHNGSLDGRIQVSAISGAVSATQKLNQSNAQYQ